MNRLKGWITMRQVRKSRLSTERSASSFNQEQLAVGTKVEMEHTDDPTEAQRIAMDHLVEDPCYYAKLRLIERNSPVNRLTRKASFFEECNRDEEGRCKPGEGGDAGESRQESKPEQSSSEQQAKARNHVVRSILSSAISIKDAAKGAAAKVGQAVWDKLSPKAQERLARTYQTAKAVEHKVMTGFRAANQLAMKAAEERGSSPEVAARVGKILATVDTASAWTVNMPAALAVTGSTAAAKVASWVPVASLAYLGYSTARNPFATARAAKKMVQEWRKKKSGKSLQRSIMKAKSIPLANADLAGELTERLANAPDPDRWMALFAAAFDETGDVEESTDAADELSQSFPQIKGIHTQEESESVVKSSKPVNRLGATFPDQALK